MPGLQRDHFGSPTLRFDDVRHAADNADLNLVN
jgi:hypothetical protein